MSDLLICNMEMPTKYPICLMIWPDGRVKKYAPYVIGEIQGECEAVQVPPHGRLVDAWYIRDAIIQKWMDKAGDSHMYKCGMEDAYEVIRNAPTIIPAETTSENEIKIIDTKGKPNYDPKHRFVIPAKEE